jgi:hypothetical protein
LARRIIDIRQAAPALDVNQGAVADRDANPAGNIADPSNFGIAVKNDETGGAALDARPGDVT